VHDQVLDMLKQVATTLKVDLPDTPGAEMGPVASFAHRDKIEQMVEAARKAGADILAGGTRPSDSRLAKGSFYLPTLIGGITLGTGTANLDVSASTFDIPTLIEQAGEKAPEMYRYTFRDGGIREDWIDCSPFYHAYYPTIYTTNLPTIK
jgi:hypothetical protein